MNFKVIAQAVSTQFAKMSKKTLYKVNIESEVIWSTYLNAFPEGSNPFFVKKTEHDCSDCRHALRDFASIVTIDSGKLVTVWDIKVDIPAYQAVADALNALVRSRVESLGVSDIFLHPFRSIGVEKSRQLLEDQSVRTWNHFFLTLPSDVVKKSDDIPSLLSRVRDVKNVFLRSLREIKPDAVETVLELISQNSIYRGEENKFAVEKFQVYQREFSTLKGVPQNEEFYAWNSVPGLPESVGKIKNTSIGTLLSDISEGYDLEDCIKSFEAKVAPANYKRPTAVVTKAMIAKAQEKIVELGYLPSLQRRFANLSDITINNVLYADRTTKKAMNVFDELSSKVAEAPKNLDRIEEVSISEFLTKIVPKAEAIEVLVENRHSGNFVSLIAPDDPTSKPLFKWPNNFSWSYEGDLTDSVKARVKAAGGKVDGDFRASLAWYNFDDLDIHLYEPGSTPDSKGFGFGFGAQGNGHIYFGNRMSMSGGNLDVDMNAGGRCSRTAVENITYPDRNKMKEGKYHLLVNNYTRKESIDGGFEVEIEFNGTTYTFGHKGHLGQSQSIIVAEFDYSKKDGIKITKSIPSQQASKTVWNVPTQTFRKVDSISLSPNYWDDVSNGNKHYFFFLEGCKRDGNARGLYNEFLSQELNEHRKVLEVVGCKMKVEESDKQLSGLGFSSTQKNDVLVRVKGAFTRQLKVTF